MRFSSAILASAFLALPAAAFAQPITGLYVGGGVGLHAPENPQITPLGPGFGGGRINLNENYGFNGELAVGYGLGNGFRFEIEGDFLQSGVRSLQGTRFFPTSPSGTVRTWGVFGNALFDLDVGSPYVFPYLGLGAGYQWTKLNNVSFRQPGGPFSFNTDSQSGAFAWQVIAGASFPLPWVPGLSATADYRFIDILGGEKFSGTGSAAGTGTVGSAIKLHNQFDHELVFGIRYAFNTPAPPPPPATPAPAAAPAPAPARSYLVFFDWDKATLTDRARQIIKEAADNSTRVQYTRIEVNGYTDTSGTPQYNQGLSSAAPRRWQVSWCETACRRTRSASRASVTRICWSPTGPGVREPQNRRVEIVIH